MVISDYTSHKQLGQAGQMGPFGHSTFTNRIPEEVVGDLKDGTFWLLRNVRLKINTNGHIEIDLYQAKWAKLEEEDDYPMLEALLE